MTAAVLDGFLDLTYKVRHVRTPAGERFYGLPIGSPIVGRPRGKSNTIKRRSERMFARSPKKVKEPARSSHEWHQSKTEHVTGGIHRRTTEAGQDIQVYQDTLGAKGGYVYHVSQYTASGYRTEKGNAKTLEAAQRAAELKAKQLQQKSPTKFSLIILPQGWKKDPRHAAFVKDVNGATIYADYSAGADAFDVQIDLNNGDGPIQTGEFARDMHDADRTAQAYAKNLTPEVVTGAQRRKKRIPTWWDHSPGVRGQDYLEKGDAWPTSDAEQEALSIQDSKDLGIQFDGDYPLEYRQLANNILWSYQDMYPGSVNLLKQMSYRNDGGSGGGALAWNVSAAKWINFNALDWNNDEKVGRSTEGASESGWWSTRWSELSPENWQAWEKAFTGTFHHEFGHSIWNETVEKNPEMMKRAMEVLKKYGLAQEDSYGVVQLDTKKIHLVLSKYGATNLHELGAEVWAEYITDPHPRNFTADLGNVMADALDEHTGKHYPNGKLEPLQNIETKPLTSANVRTLVMSDPDIALDHYTRVIQTYQDQGKLPNGADAAGMIGRLNTMIQQLYDPKSPRARRFLKNAGSLLRTYTTDNGMTSGQIASDLNELASAFDEAYRHEGKAMPRGRVMPDEWTGGSLLPEPKPAHLQNQNVNADGTPHTGTFLGFVPSPDDLKRIAVPGGEPEGQLHTTAMYLGKAKDIPQEVQDGLLEAIGTWAGGQGSIKAEGFNVGIFGPMSDKDTCITLGCGGDELASAKDSIVTAAGKVFAQHGWEPPQQHNPWVPHITLEYTNDVTRAAQHTGRTGPLKFDRVRVALGSKSYDFPLESGGKESKGWQDKLPKNQKCKFCSGKATKRILHSEGHGYIPVCGSHLAKGKEAAANCTPDKTHDPSNINGVYDIKDMRARFVDLAYKRVVRTEAGARKYGVPIGRVIGGHHDNTHTGHRSSVVGRATSSGSRHLLTPAHMGRAEWSKYQALKPHQREEVRRIASEHHAAGGSTITESWRHAFGHDISQVKKPRTARGRTYRSGQVPKRTRKPLGTPQEQLAALIAEHNRLIGNLGFLGIRKKGEPANVVDRLLDLSYKRRVRTAAGARTFHESIGSEIVDHPNLPGGGSLTHAGGASHYPGMHPASDQDKADFRKKVGKAIPPAWTDVHVADHLDTAKLLVRGKDAKGRPQSVYSAAHTQAQAEIKFKRVKGIVPHLAKLDHAIERDAKNDDHAAALMLIRRLGMRPGSEKDTGAKEHAHGATNLRAKHVSVKDGVTSFDFIGKKGVHIQLKTSDPQIAEMIAERLKKRKGDDRLFVTDENKTRAYMKTTGVPDGFMLKDLRTVHANVVALREIKARGDAKPKNKAEFLKWRKEIAVLVSDELGNTPTLALSSYINPTVFTPWVMDGSWV